jgi:hypothetical protein
MYLLPAGESTFLGGIKSMVVDPFPPTKLLSKHLSKRYMPLEGEKILIVFGKGKTFEAKVPPTLALMKMLTDSRKITISSFLRLERGKSVNVLRWGKSMRF